VIGTNLSTRPFYNERAVHAVAAIVAVLVLAAAAWEGVRVVRLSRYKTELNTAIQKHHAETELRDREAAQIRSGLDQKQLAIVSTQAKEANGLIEQRTFSWTELFNLLEATLPDDVMLTSVRPEFKEGITQINLEVQGRSVEDIQAFWDRLEKTGAFHDVQWSTVNVEGDNGLDKMQMRAVYTHAQGSTRPPVVKK
jgi:Tfp pilus assembly protein PilN